MKRRLFAGIVISLAVSGLTPDDPAEARRPIHWKVGEYQTSSFDARPGDTVSVFFGTRDTPANIKKCDHMGGKGLILTRWRNKLWEVCYKVDF